MHKKHFRNYAKHTKNIKKGKRDGGYRAYKKNVNRNKACFFFQEKESNQSSLESCFCCLYAERAQPNVHCHNNTYTQIDGARMAVHGRWIPRFLCILMSSFIMYIYEYLLLLCVVCSILIRFVYTFTDS